ncbi:PEGA domain-containing protein [Leptospira sp. 96542]|nr:PEGA domain-containing protein [Leptospira sp. 96542]
MRYVYLPVLCVFLGFCASVSKIETLNRSFSKPKFVTPELGEVDPLPSGRDHKERQVNKSKVNFSLLWVAVPEEFDTASLQLLEEKVLYHHRELGVYKKSPKVSDPKFAEKEDLDLILEAKLSKDDNRFKIEIFYKDPVLNHNFGNSLFLYSEENELDPKKNKSIEVFHGKKQLIPLGASVPSYFAEVSAPSDEELKTIFTASIQGAVSVFSTTPGTSIYLDGKEIGKAPLIAYPLLNGKHKLSFAKPGKDPVNRTILVRAGKTNRVFQEWDDDISQGTLVVSSFPTGLDTIIGGQKKGKTQYAESGVPYGSYPVQYVRTKDDSNFEYAKTTVIIRPKKITSIALPINLENGIGWEAEEFWNLTSPSPNFQVTFPGSLNFAKSKDLPKGWYGVYTEDLIPDRIEAELTLDLKKNLNGSFGFYVTDQKDHSLLVYVDGNDYHIISFGASENSAPVRSSFRWQKEDEEKGRTLSIETDIEKKIFKLYLGNTKVEEVPWNFENFWNIAILTSNESTLTGAPVRSFKLKYPDMKKFEEKLNK